MDFLKVIGVDPDADSNGKWIEWAGQKFKIARYNNPRHIALEGKLRRALRASIPKGKHPTPEQQLEVENKALAETVLLGWDIEEFDGVKPFPYSKENAYKMLSDPRAAVFRTQVILEATDFANYALASEQDAVEQLKNA